MNEFVRPAYRPTDPDTSKLAWENFKPKRLGKRSQQVLMVLRMATRPMTGQEIAAQGIPGAWKRTSELEEKGLIERCGVRPCSETGEIVLMWRIKK